MTEKFVSPCAPPEGEIRELLTILAEECCEVGQRVSKALRFGVDEVQPGQPWCNGERIALELGDIEAVVLRLVALGVFTERAIEIGKINKGRQLAKFMQSAPAA